MDYAVLFPEQLQQYLRALRKARGLTQMDVSARLGVVQSRIAALERKPEAMSVEQLFKLLTALDVQLVLRDGAAPPMAGDQPSSSATPPKGDW
jgi:HTH-type transcriptional regulator / antitoxin HipB